MAKRQKLGYFDSAENVGKRLKAAREAAGLSQLAVAGGDCTAAYISRIEAGARVPSLQLMRRMADRLGVSESYLAFGTGGPGLSPGRKLAEAKVAIQLGDLELARQLVDAALSTSQSDRDRAEASALYGQIDAASGNWRQSIDSLERARKLHSAIEETDPSVSETLGRAYAHVFEYGASIAVFERARDIARANADKLNELRFATLLAHAQTDAGDFAAAATALGSAVKLADELDDPLSRARALWARSRVAAHQGDPDSAALYAESALEHLEIAHQTYFAALARQLLAGIETDRGNPQRALELLELGEPLILATGRVFERASFKIEITQLLALRHRARQ